MSFRQDKLVLLLETGTSAQVRRTAAKQLAELTVKTFHATTTPSPVQHAEANGNDVKPDVKEDNQDGKFTLAATGDEDEAWNEVLLVIAKLIPLLKSKSSETRQASAHALGLLAQSLPKYSVIPVSDPSSSKSQPLDLATLLKEHDTLLASAGREYIAKPVNAADRAKRRKAMMGSIGLGETVGWGDDVDNVIGEDDESMDIDSKAANGGTVKVEAEPPKPVEPPKDIFEGLSARQITMLKRKKGNIVEEANKLRKLNQQIAGGEESKSTPSTAAPTPTNSPPLQNGSLPKTESITIDPGAKARAAGAGGAVEPDVDAEGNAVTKVKLPTLLVEKGVSPWLTVIDAIEPTLHDPAWQSRHGSAISIMDVIRSVGSSLPSIYLIDLSQSLLQLLALDRFGDFVGDTVIAPVRETAAQALGVLLKYLDREDVAAVHGSLVEMVRQSWAKRRKEAASLSRGEKFSWEVRHAGLLGLKYEVAVRRDLLSEQWKGEEDVKPGMGDQRSTMLQDVVDSAVLALSDIDDDVRSVAASALLPITDTLATTLSQEELEKLVDTLWDCLAGDSDELGSSTGAIMDLLGALINRIQVIDIMSSPDREDGPRSRRALISKIYAFLRHPIATVRLAVVQALLTLITVPVLPRGDWLNEEPASLLLENLLLEEREDVRAMSFAAFTAAMQEIERQGKGEKCDILTWYELTMTPIGLALDERSFFHQGKRRLGHNIDQHMIKGDISLVSTESVLQNRVATAKALAPLLDSASSEADSMDSLRSNLGAGSALQMTLSAVIIQEWASAGNAKTADSSVSLGTTNDKGQQLTKKLLDIIQSPPQGTYREMDIILQGIRNECQNLLNAFSTEGKVSKDKIPELPIKVTASSAKGAAFTLVTAQRAVGEHFDKLSTLLSKNSAKLVLPSLRDRQRKVMASIGYFGIMKERYDVMVFAAVAGALIALRVMPPKFGPVIKATMDSVKKEESLLLQSRSADSVSAFVQYCNSPLFTGKVNPCDKIIKNLFTFLCSDVTITPIFTAGPNSSDGIISLKEEKASTAASAGAKRAGVGAKDVPEETEEQLSARLTRRGALEAFRALARRFGGGLFEQMPKVWEIASGALSSTFTQTAVVDEVDAKLAENTAQGQEVIDGLTSLRFLVHELDPSLHVQLLDLLPSIICALSSSYALIRSTAAKCLAAICDVVTEQGMKLLVDYVVPMVGDAKRVSSRQGAVEAIHHVIKTLDIKVLPYVLFLIVPILGRMSDPDESTRLLSTSTFASLVKMVPLEAGIPDPPGFSHELLAKRDEERKFLMQLLDGSKAEQYEIPIPIKADLRQYQRDGVSWLAFLAKYQLHGILCDDMGLGKSLQSICIVGSKHHERAAKFAQSGSVDSAHLPSLIVCPPTLTGHWYYEIKKFTDHLTPFQYTGTAAERAHLRSRINHPTTDVVIASYESVRADIQELSKVNWLYCVLDEGHIIKNSKTKLSAAVKQIKAQHRLLLSGTPIQNNVLELWSLFDFLMPGFLGNERVFNDRFSKPILADRDGKATQKEREVAASALESLHKQVLPFLLRRLKEDVLQDLPPKIIQDYYCDLSPVQKALYDEFAKSRAAEEAGEAVSSDSAQPGQGHVFQSLQYLRKLCNHPALVMEGEDGKRRWEQVVSKVGAGVLPIKDISHSPKLEALRQLLIDCGIGQTPGDKITGNEPTGDAAQHRVLIFCQSRPMLDIIQRDLFAGLMPSVKYMRMDGQTDPKKRHAIVQTYNEDPTIDVLLLTTSVGGLGLNLTGADTVIFVDHDWNPMKDLQAMDRAHRLGQKKVVNVYRLITRGTLEEKIMGLQRFKLNIASSVVTQQNAGLGSMNTGEVLDLFKVSSEGDSVAGGATKAKPTGAVSASKVLEGLEDLPPEDEYAELSLENFMSKV